MKYIESNKHFILPISCSSYSDQFCTATGKKRQKKRTNNTKKDKGNRSPRGPEEVLVRNKLWFLLLKRNKTEKKKADGKP